MPSRIRVLFVGESVTMAHVVRPHWLAERLDPETFDVHFATDGQYRGLLDGENLRYWHLACKDSRRFLDAVETGRALYRTDELMAYVRDELRLIEQVAPDAIVGDFRHTLSVSARLSAVPYIGLINAYWSPYSVHKAFPVPEVRGLNLHGFAPMPKLMPAVSRAFAWFQGRALNAVRKRYGQAPYRDCLHGFTSADRVLYYDVEPLVPVVDAPQTHAYLGPVSWSPRVPLPAWWPQLREDRPTAYVSLGSSGNVALIDAIVDALRSRGLQVAISTAGRYRATQREGVFAADFLPGDEAARRADLVVCNGGSPTCYQAFAQGTPVIGIPANMDQLLAMRSIQAYGAGLEARMAAVSAGRLGGAVDALMADDSYRRNARRLAELFAATDPARTLRDCIEDCLRPARQAARAAA